jgi:phosphoribosyl-ATP pyrophosphohydrolase
VQRLENGAFVNPERGWIVSQSGRQRQEFCYVSAMSDFTLSDLDQIVRQRASASPDESYTARLLNGGIDRAAKKLGEEAVEAVIAAIANRPDELVKEAADVFYHLLVVLHGSGISLQAVMDELDRRTRQSGLQEKASRRP